MTSAQSSAPLAVVTGASSGIGYELAVQLATHGFDLIIAAENDKIGRAREQLKSLGSNVEAVQANLATYDGVEELYSKIESAGRPVDALVLNAGVGVSGDFARETNLRDEINLIHLNVLSPVHLSKRVLKSMVRRGAGRVLFTSSIAATMPGPFEATYAASKAFLKSFAEAIRNELKDTGVTVTTLMPGPTETEFFERAGLQDTKLGASEKDPASEVARQGYEAMMAGKDQVVAGSLKNKVEATMAHVLPDTVTAEIHRKLAEPGSKRH